MVLKARIVYLWYWKHGLSICGTGSTDYLDAVLEARIVLMWY